MAATREWLESAPGHVCTVQIAGVRYPENLRDWLRNVARVVSIDDILVFSTSAGGQPIYTVLYGKFADCRAAAKVRPDLPEELGAKDPILRTAQGIRDEIARRTPIPSGG